MAVTHRYKPPPAVEIGSFALAAVGGIVFGGMHDEQLHVGLATFYVVTNLLTTVFLIYFITRLWGIGRRPLAVWTAVVTAAATFIAITYDFFPFPFDDENRTIFYTAALTTWGAQAITYFSAYRAMHGHNVAEDAVSARAMGAPS